MSDPKEIREAVSRTDHWYLDAITDAALAYADSLEDPIWWCFVHEQVVRPDAVRCLYGTTQLARAVAKAGHRIDENPCDIAKATRPRRIET